MIHRFCLVFVCILIGSDEAHSQKPPTPPSTSPQPRDVSDAEDSDWVALEQAVTKYVEAYNSGDAAAIGDLYTEQAELVDTAGTSFRGRDSIRTEYETFFKNHPEASIKIIVDSLRFVAPTVAIEEGRSESQLSPNETPSFSKYRAIHTKEGDGWRLASVRDEEVTEEAGAHLEALDWLIGKWIDEAPESLMTIDCYWHESGAYLIRDFEIEIEGLLASSGTERIGWDPLQQKVRSWLFDSDGGFLEGTWVKQGEHWTIAAHGYRPDGVPTHATYTVTPLREDAYHLGASNRTAGVLTLEDFEMTIVRQPPQPGDVPSLEVSPRRNPDSE